MTVFGLAIDPLSQRPLVILKDPQGKNTVPVWISNLEIVAIAAELISRDIASQSGRGDLLYLMMKEMGIRISRITLEGQSDGIITASVFFDGGGDEVKVMVRPSEALIAALKYKLPVMVADEVVVRASLADIHDETIVREDDARRFADFLDNLDPADMGKYPM
jgi:bifunctional DNase/RNase